MLLLSHQDEGYKLGMNRTNAGIWSLSTGICIITHQGSEGVEGAHNAFKTMGMEVISKLTFLAFLFTRSWQRETCTSNFNISTFKITAFFFCPDCTSCPAVQNQTWCDHHLRAWGRETAPLQAIRHKKTRGHVSWVYMGWGNQGPSPHNSSSSVPWLIQPDT